MGHSSSILILAAICCSCAATCRGQSAGADTPQPASAEPTHAAEYPLRLHILAIDDTHRTVRMQPNWSSGTLPDPSADGASASSSAGSLSLGGGDDDFSGAGRADLVTPPNGTAGATFTYEGCNRVRVAPGFQGLEARWIKADTKLEVILPTEAVTDGPVPTQHCTLRLVTQPFVYLRMRNGAIVRVTQEAYNKKPSLRVFLSGGSETLKRRQPKLPMPASPAIGPS